MNTYEESSAILRPHRTLEKNGVPALEWTDGEFAGIKFTISSVVFTHDEDKNPVMSVDYTLHDDVQLTEEQTPRFEAELTDFTFGLIIFGKLKNDEEFRTSPTEQPDT